MIGIKLVYSGEKPWGAGLHLVRGFWGGAMSHVSTVKKIELVVQKLGHSN